MKEKQIKVVAHNIIGTNLHIHEAWTPSNLMSGHSTITHIDNQVYGRIGTSRTQNYQAQYEEAYKAIISEYPELKHAQRHNGSIVIYK